MKMKQQAVIVLSVLVCALMAQAGEPAAEMDVAMAVEEGVPGGIVVSTVTLQAKVVSIDYETREVGLLLPGGAVEVIEVGPEVINFNQIKKGDMITAQVTQQLVIGMGASDSELDDGEDTVILAAAPGEKPGAVSADTVRQTATVVEIDGELRTARLRFADGSEEIVEVRDDIDLTKHSVGDKVVFEMTEMVAISVEKR